jgi:hypothetical protein
MKRIPRLMTKNELFPNNATIPATCKYHQAKLVSHDPGFIFPPEEENFELIRDSNS